MDTSDVERWFDRYLDTFAACGRGERPPSELLAHYGVPLLLTTDDGALVQPTAEDVVVMATGQVEGMRAAGYHHSDVAALAVEPLNGATALVHGDFTRHRADGELLGRISATYLLTGTGEARRISALVVRSA